MTSPFPTIVLLNIAMHFETTKCTGWHIFEYYLTRWISDMQKSDMIIALKTALSGTSNIIFMKWGKHRNVNDTNSLRLLTTKSQFLLYSFPDTCGQSCNTVQEHSRWFCFALFWLDMGRLSLGKCPTCFRNLCYNKKAQLHHMHI